MLRDDAVEGLDVLQGATHEHGVAHTHAIVTEDAHPRRRVGHGAQLGEVLPLEPHGDGSHGMDIAVASLDPAAPHLLDHTRGVGHRSGVGHRMHGGEAPQCGRRGAAGDRLGILATGLTQMRVQIHEARQHHEAATVDDLVGAARGAARRRQLGDAAVGHGDIDGVLAVGPDIAQCERHALASSVRSAAPSSR